MQRYIPIEQGTPGWQFAPVPTWGGNPLNAGPRRVGVGCAAGGCGCGGSCGATEDAYKQVGWGYVAAGSALALIAGLLIGYAAGGKKYSPNRKRGRSRVWTKNGKLLGMAA
jgi:hypothetical protein